jgi:hypothetical protein
MSSAAKQLQLIGSPGQKDNRTGEKKTAIVTEQLPPQIDFGRVAPGSGIAISAYCHRGYSLRWSR